MRRRLETAAYWCSLAAAHAICWLLDSYDKLTKRTKAGA